MGLLGSIGKAVSGVVGGVGKLAGGVLGGGAAPVAGGDGGSAAPANNSGLLNYLAQQQATAQQSQLANQQQNAQLMQGGGMVPGGAPATPQPQPMMAGSGDSGMDANEQLAATLKALRGY